MLAKKPNDRVLSIVDKYISKVKDNNIRVYNAYIFGSHVLGNAREDSDVDVCIVSPDFTDSFESGVFLSKIAAADKDTSIIEPHVMTPDDMKNTHSHLVYTILETGYQATRDRAL